MAGQQDIRFAVGDRALFSGPPSYEGSAADPAPNLRGNPFRSIR